MSTGKPDIPTQINGHIAAIEQSNKKIENLEIEILNCRVLIDGHYAEIKKLVKDYRVRQ